MKLNKERVRDMKVIDNGNLTILDLINKIAYNEEMPKIIEVLGCEWEWIDEYCDYSLIKDDELNKFASSFLFKHIFESAEYENKYALNEIVCLLKWKDLSECGEKTIDDKALEIIKKKKPIPQAKKLMEEAWEVGESIIDYEHGYGSREHMVEEIGDALFVIKQFRLFYNITDEEISEVHEYKAERTLSEMGGDNVSEQKRNRE